MSASAGSSAKAEEAPRPSTSTASTAPPDPPRKPAGVAAQDRRGTAASSISGLPSAADLLAGKLPSRLPGPEPCRAYQHAVASADMLCVHQFACRHPRGCEARQPQHRLNPATAARKERAHRHKWCSLAATAGPQGVVSAAATEGQVRGEAHACEPHEALDSSYSLVWSRPNVVTEDLDKMGLKHPKHAASQRS